MRHDSPSTRRQLAVNSPSTRRQLGFLLDPRKGDVAAAVGGAALRCAALRCAGAVLSRARQRQRQSTAFSARAWAGGGRSFSLNLLLAHGWLFHIGLFCLIGTNLARASSRHTPHHCG
jgi:hypothetical protein